MLNGRKQITVETICNYLLKYADFTFYLFGKNYDTKNIMNLDQLFEYLYFNDKNKDILKFVLTNFLPEPRDIASIILYNKEIANAPAIIKSDFIYTVICNKTFFPLLADIFEVEMRKKNIMVGELYEIRYFPIFRVEIENLLNDISTNLKILENEIRKDIGERIKNYFIYDFDGSYEVDEEDLPY